jgi:uncharacterized membrane protein
MEILKTAIQTRFKSLLPISVALIFSAMILMLRMKLNKSFSFVFLIWNVFLAIIPFVITMYLKTSKNLNKIKLGFAFLIWLAFLPNAPYIVTDLIHIRIGNDSRLWLDVLVLLSFALSGLLLFYTSIIDMQQLLKLKFKKLPTEPIVLVILFLCGFGVYLGRFLRYNSWEIISQPQILISDVFNIIIAPYQHYEAWLFTLGFGVFLVVGFWLFKNLKHISTYEN